METKPAIYTTEFWTTIATSVYMFLNATNILNEVPQKWAVVAWAVVQAFYSVGRGIAKNKGSFDPTNNNNYRLVPKKPSHSHN